ncbi:MAG: hypothetical protein B6244_11280 [Candidatus Cloacimonetes bacterium 4572_55]|nr:MAG: hypothetical protein B6244_11280 [Candidatus Cloacimonetes bacterium 4572_55]
MNEFEVVKWEKSIESDREVYIHEDSEISQTGGRLLFLIEGEEAGKIGKPARQIFCKELLARYHSFNEIRDTITHLFSSIQQANQALLEFFEENDIPGHQGLMVTILVLESNRVYHFQVGSQPFLIWRNKMPIYLGSRYDSHKPPSEEEISLRETMRLPVQSITDEILQVQEMELKKGDILLIGSSNLASALSSEERARDLVENRSPAEIRDEIRRAIEAMTTPTASAVLGLRANFFESLTPKKKNRPKKTTSLNFPQISLGGREKMLLFLPVLIVLFLAFYMTIRLFVGWWTNSEEETAPPEETSVVQTQVTEISVPAGKMVWEFNARKEISSSPYVDDGLVYFGCKDDYIYALDAKTGKLAWRYRTGDGIGSSPTTNDSLLFIGSYDYNLYAVHKKSGKLAWRYRTDGKLVSSPTLGGNTLYVGSNDYGLHAVSAFTGQEVWKIKTQNIVWAKALLFNNRIFFPSVDGYFYCATLGGQPEWRTDIGKGTYGLYSSPAAENNMIYLGSKDGALYAVDAIAGDVKWVYQTGGIIRSSPVADNGKVYFGSEDQYLYCLTAKGDEYWKFKTEGGVNSSPSVQNGIVYVGSDDHQLYAIDSVTGAKRWSYDVGSPIYSSPFVEAGVVYVGSKNGLLKAISTGGF